MNKLMVALATVATAVCSEAATFQWYHSGSAAQANTVTEESPGGTALASGTVYLIDANKYSQQALFTALAATPDWDMSTVTSLASSKAYNTATLSTGTKFGTASKGTINSGGRASWDPIADGYAVDSDYAFYEVIVSGENFYITDNLTGKVSDTGNSYIKADNAVSRTYNVPAELPAKFEHGGWYTAVPEPTSGLLLLLGVAGLALRRRRA